MEILYIAPSYLPSINANGVHVINQCSSLNEEGASVTLLTCRKEFSEQKNLNAMKDRYGRKNIENISNIKSIFYPFNFGLSIVIAIFSLLHIFFFNRKDIILSRNIYAVFFSILLGKKNIVYETHQLENGIRKKIQSKILNTRKIKFILISNQLKKFLESHHNVIIKNEIILHDAAPKNISILSEKEKSKNLSNIGIDRKKYDRIIGYFGQLYEGRGIEIINKIASYFPSDLFLIYGGSEKDVKTRVEKNKLLNIKFMGMVSHPEAISMMQSVDILLMPYQKNVSIGQLGHNTAPWMSPMKMFEYMASSSAIVSSNHLVLKEVLKDKENSMICEMDNYLSWVEAIKNLKNDSQLMNRIVLKSYDDYKNYHTWNIRGKKIIKFITN